MKKGSKAAKAWGRKMQRLRAAKTRSPSKRAKVKVKRRKTRRTLSMARRKKTYRRRARSATSSLMHGVFKPKGIIASVVLGMGAAALAQYVPVQVPYKSELAAGLIGGVPAALGVFALKQIPALGMGQPAASNGYVAGY
jgi:hypothetical protein